MRIYLSTPLYRKFVLIPIGVSTFATKPELVGPDHLAPLLDHALKHVPKEEVPDTPFFLLATAGMRLLHDNQRSNLLSEICTYVSETTQFQLPDCDLHVQVIPGETEGLYGWIAANYLVGGFDHPAEHDHGKGHHTYGFLDMGGASAQIAFVPNATESEKHAEDLKLLRLRTIDGVAEEYRVFVTTWLGFGANEARRRYVEALESSILPTEHELPDPCLPTGLNVTESGEPIETGSDEALGLKPHLTGTGNFEECMRQTYPLLEKNKPCPDSPCLINGQHVPAIDFDVNHFVGVSEYWHTTHEVFAMGKGDDVRDYDFHIYQDRVSAFCALPWSEMQRGVSDEKWGKKVDEQTAREVCFKASWLINMLHEGIGIPRLGIEGHNATKAAANAQKAKGYLDPFQAVDKIKDTEVSWTLGKMVLYASAQIPPPDASSDAADSFLPVGFGSNVADVSTPPDFQTPSGHAQPLLPPAPEQEVPPAPAGSSQSSDWPDVLFSESPRRIPGMVLFVVILVVALWLFCGRERRRAWASGVWRRRGGGGGGGGRFGSPGGRRVELRLPAAASRWADKVFRRRDRAYEMLDPVRAAATAADDEEAGFELRDGRGVRLDDGSDGDDLPGRSSGCATPSLHPSLYPADGSGSAGGSPSRRAQGYSFGGGERRDDGLVGTALALPGVASATDIGNGGGLVVRTDSRERLTQSLGRSTAGSPFRVGSRSPGLKAS